MRLQVALRHAGQRNAVVMAKFDDRVAMRVGADQRRQLLDVLNVGKVVELERVGPRIEVADRLGADARLEHKSVVAGPANDTDVLEPPVAAGSVMSVPPFPSDAKLNVPLKLSNVKLAA